MYFFNSQTLFPFGEKGGQNALETVKSKRKKNLRSLQVLSIRAVGTVGDSYP